MERIGDCTRCGKKDQVLHRLPVPLLSGNSIERDICTECVRSLQGWWVEGLPDIRPYMRAQHDKPRT